MRVSSVTNRQTIDLQHDALIAAGVDARHLYEDHASGAQDDRTGLAEAMAFAQPGDTIVVWKLDRLLCLMMVFLRLRALWRYHF